MQLLTTVGNKRIAELLADRTEGDAVDDRAIAGLEAQSQMRLAYFVGVDELMRRQCQHHVRIAAPERTCAVERGRKLRRHRARGDRAVDIKLVDMARLRDVARQRAFEIGAKLG